MITTHGIHHVSSIVGHAQQNIDFNSGVLGLRLVKKTLNFDDSSSYHFYFSNADASTGLTTTFPWNDAQEGKHGRGQVLTITYGIPYGQLDFWKKRLESFKIDYEFDQTLRFQDPVGLNIELVEVKAALNSWEFNGITSSQAILGIDSLTLLSKDIAATIKLLTEVLGYRIVSEDDLGIVLKVNDELGGMLKLDKTIKVDGHYGIGTVHHLALRIKDSEIDEWVEILRNAGYHPTEIKDRKYFRSLYFRDQGGILFELATEGPGMGVDEQPQDWGTNLMIPPHFQNLKEQIENTLMPVTVREVSELSGYGYRDKYEYEIFKKREQLLKEINRLSKTNKNSETLTKLRQQFIELTRKGN